MNIQTDFRHTSVSVFGTLILIVDIVGDTPKVFQKLAVLKVLGDSFNFFVSLV